MKDITLVRRLEGHEWTCSALEFHPNSNMLASSSWDRTIRVWDVADGRELRRIDKNQHTAPITCVRWHPNGALLASTSADNTTCLWDATTGKKMRTLKEHFGWVLQCSFAPDRTKLATCSWDKTVRLWDPNTGELISTLRGHTKGVWACEFYPVGHTSALLATAGDDCTARLWDTRTRKCALTLSGGHADSIYSIGWSADGNRIATGSADKTVTVWDPKAGKVLKMLKGHTDTVKACSWTPTESFDAVPLLLTTGGFSANLWNPGSSNNNLICEAHMHAPGKEIECAHIAPSGKLMATGGRDGMVNLCALPDLTKADFDDRKAHTTHQEWRAKVRHDEDVEFSQILQRRLPKKKEDEEAPPPASEPSDPSKELMRRWKQRGVAAEGGDDAAAAAAAGQQREGVTPRDAPVPKSVWGGTDWVDHPPEGDGMSDIPMEPLPFFDQSPMPLQQKRVVSKEKAMLAQAAEAARLQGQVLPPPPPPPPQAGEKPATGWRKAAALTFQAPNTAPPKVDPRRAVFQNQSNPPTKAPPPAATAEPPAPPKKLAISDSVTLMQRLREKTDAEAYMSVAEPGRVVPKSKAPEPKPVTVEDLMVKPKITAKVKTGMNH